MDKLLNIWYNECMSIHYTWSENPCRYANHRFAPCNRAIIPYALRLYGIMNAWAFIILDPKALADTQIIDLLPAIGQLYHMCFAYMV